MSSPDRGRGDSPGSRSEPAATTKAPGNLQSPADAVDPYSSWLDRMQRGRARHAAITKNLYTWASYKSWADKMRDSWEDDEPPTGAPTGATPVGAPKLPIKK
jgi:hypothetical protein